MNQKILHLFQWDCDSILNNLQEIKNSGWTAILTNPVQPSKENTDLWYMNYQITGLKIGNKYFNEESLKELCTKAHEIGLKIYVDVIITHYGNKGGHGLDRYTPHELVDNELKNNPYIWRNKKDINYNDRYSITHDCNGLASIDVSNYDYQDLVINFFNKLIDLGVDGFRIDSAKMIALPHEFNENNMFFERVINGLNKKDVFVFGETIFTNADLLKQYQKYISPLSNFSGDCYEVDKNKLVVFFEDHDFYLDEELRCTGRMPESEIIVNYKYLLSGFNNVLYYPRPFSDSWKCEEIKRINNTYK